jgi:Protein of unknown function (DUF1573)
MIRTRHCALCAVAFGVSYLVFCLMTDGLTSHPLTFDPPDVRLSEAVNEGDLAKAHFELVNQSAATIVVDQIRGGCSCTIPKMADGQAFIPKTELAPHTRLPLSVEILTAGHTGNQELPVEATAHVNGQEVECSTTIRLFVRSGWRANPSEIVIDQTVPNSPIHKTIELFDGYPDPGIHLKSIRVSNPQRLKADFVEVRDTSSADLKKRYEIHLILMPAQTMSNNEFTTDLVSLVPADDRELAKSIVIQWRNEQAKTRLVPGSLVIVVPNNPQVVRRRVVCVGATDLKVISKPSFVTVAIDKNVLSLKVALPERLSGSAEVVLTAGKETLSLPITFAKVE